MSDLPPYASLAGTRPEVLQGLVVHHAAAALEATYRFAWERDRALLTALDHALQDAAAGRCTEEAGRPRWLDGLVARELTDASTRSWSQGRFGRVRLLERLGMVSLEPDDTYVLAMVSGLGPGKADRLRADPGLVERALWRVFEVEGGGEVSLTNVDRFGDSEADGWRATFLALVVDGTLDRTRVLQECLWALGRDFAAYRAGWFSATYLALGPTTEEDAAFQPELRRLLGAAVPATVSFALKQLVGLSRAGTLDVAATLGVLAPATVGRAKGTALEALRLARTAGDGHHDAVVRVATTALGHTHADVQRAAAQLLTDLDARAPLDDAGDDLAPSVRHDLGVVGPGPAPAGRSPVQQPTQPLAAIPAPVHTEELAERVAALLEDASDAMELEAVLAALAVAGTESVLTPLRKRSRQVIDRSLRRGTGDVPVSVLVAGTVLGLLGEERPGGESDDVTLRFLGHRMAELRELDAPLLATPDLPGGWVSAAALVERIALSPQLRHHDLVAALLRLHPDGREDADREGLPAAVRHALTGLAPENASRTARPGPAAWWVAADRSRAPYAEAERPQVSSELRTYTWEENGSTRTGRHRRFAVRTSIARSAADDQPTELEEWHSDPPGLGGSRSPGDWISSLAAIWPHDTEHFLAHAALTVLESPGWTEASHHVSRTLDALARHPGRMGDLATRTLAAGLTATRRDDRLHAVDAFLDLVPTGRVRPGDLADVMAECAEAWPAQRWAESLGAASTGPGGRAVVVELLSTLLPQLPPTHRGINRLLDVLLEESLQHGTPVADPGLRQWLGGLTGSSAAARTARRLLR